MVVREEGISIASTVRPSETTTLRIVEDVLAEQLPSEWTARFVRAPGRFRFCFVNPTTTVDDIDAIIDAMR